VITAYLRLDAVCGGAQGAFEVVHDDFLARKGFFCRADEPLVFFVQAVENIRGPALYVVLGNARERAELFVRAHQFAALVVGGEGQDEELEGRRVFVGIFEHILNVFHAVVYAVRIDLVQRAFSLLIIIIGLSDNDIGDGARRIPQIVLKW